MRAHHITLVLGLSLVSLAQAQTLDDLVSLRQGVQACSAQKKLDLRAKCFEAVAFRALDSLARLGAMPVKTAEELAQEREAQATKEKAVKQAALFAKARADLAKNFKDPDSVKFESVRLTKKGIYCAKVNAKNSYGGYVGFRDVMGGPRWAFMANGDFHVTALRTEDYSSDNKDLSEQLSQYTDALSLENDVEKELIKRMRATGIADQQQAMKAEIFSEWVNEKCGN